MSIKLFWWRVRYTYHFCRRTGYSPSFGWEIACMDDMDGGSFADGMPPQEAVDTELSYWTD
jgi:hypothetical protein